MILKASGTAGPCQLETRITHGAQGLSLSSINVPPNSAEYSPEFVDAITHNGVVVTIPAQASLEDFVQFLNSITHNSTKVVDVYFVYSESLFEMYAKYAITLSSDFAAYLGTTTVNFAANDIYDTVWNVEAKDPVDEYFVEAIASIDGVIEEGETTRTLGYVQSSRGTCKDDFLFRFKETTHSVVIRVKYRLKTGEKRTCVSPSAWSVTLKLR